MNLFIRTLAAMLCALCLVLPAAAAQVDSGSVYCFGTEDFSREDATLTGICLTDLPEPKVGTVCLGSRMLRPGDVLTAEQAAQMTFSPAATGVDRTVEVGYLPICGNTVAAKQTMTLTIHGKEDQPPIAEDSALETYKNLDAAGKLKVKDPENQAMTFTVTRQPKRGTVTIGQDGSFTYTPKKNKVGIDSFTYTATDPAGKTSREATVTVTILKPSQSPQYTDTAGRDCRFAAEWMKNTGIFSGETVSGHPCFSPEQSVSQGEFLTMLVKTLDIPVDEEITYTGYADVPRWLQPYLAAAVRSGLTKELQTFCADDPISMDSAKALITCALEPERAEPVFAACPEGNFVLTRSEAAKLLYETSLQAGTAPRPRIWK